LHKLHLGPCQLQEITVFQQNGVIPNRRTIQRGAVASFHVCDNKPVTPLGDGRYRYARLSDGCHNFGQRHFTTRSRT